MKITKYLFIGLLILAIFFMLGCWNETGPSKEPESENESEPESELPPPPEENYPNLIIKEWKASAWPIETLSECDFFLYLSIGNYSDITAIDIKYFLTLRDIHGNTIWSWEYVFTKVEPLPDSLLGWESTAYYREGYTINKIPHSYKLVVGYADEKDENYGTIFEGIFKYW